jgi:hypothetical protein
MNPFWSFFLVPFTVAQHVIVTEALRQCLATGALPGHHHGGLWKNQQAACDIVVGQDTD